MQLENEVRGNSVRQGEGKEEGREEALHNPNVSDANITATHTY